MLGILLLSFVGAFVCTAITEGIGLIVYRKYDNELGRRILCIIASFILDLIYMVTVFDIFRQELTVLGIARYIWPILILDCIIIRFVMKYADYGFISTIILAIISLIICISGEFAPVQYLIYAHDIENVDISYAAPSSEILGKIDVKTYNNGCGRKYYVENPEIRFVNGKYIAVFHIGESILTDIHLEYIPGYAIQEEGKNPEIVPSRIYFDTSFTDDRDALRVVRRKYKTEVIGEHKFDIDDDGNPYEIFAYRENLYFSNGEDYGLIILNLNDGTSEKYPVSENQIPEWVDFETTYPR